MKRRADDEFAAAAAASNQARFVNPAAVGKYVDT